MSSPSVRDIPVHPNLTQLKRQAKDLLRLHQSGDPEAVDLFRRYHPRPSDAPKLADAQLAIARSYGIPSWTRLVMACHMTDAIWTDDVEAVRALILKDPKLLVEDARGVKGNWGPPMSYAATAGRPRIVAMLRELGAQDVQYAFERACLKGWLDTARQLYDMGGRPELGSVMGPCETVNGDGLEFLLSLGAELADSDGDRLKAVGLIMETYSRDAKGKHKCLELVAKAGIWLPDTPPMAVHRGRRDLLEAHLAQDPLLLSRTFTHRDIFPPEIGCSEEPGWALHGTPLDGTTLLHLCVDYDEFELAEWMLANGADANALAAVDKDGFGGHTPIYGTIVSQPYRTGVRAHERFTRLLLDHGARTNVRASLRKALKFAQDETLHEFRDVTPKEWGQRFQVQAWVNPEALKLV